MLNTAEKTLFCCARKGNTAELSPNSRFHFRDKASNLVQKRFSCIGLCGDTFGRRYCSRFITRLVFFHLRVPEFRPLLLASYLYSGHTSGYASSEFWPASFCWLDLTVDTSRSYLFVPSHPLTSYSMNIAESKKKTCMPKKNTCMFQGTLGKQHCRFRFFAAAEIEFELTRGWDGSPTAATRVDAATSFSHVTRTEIIITKTKI